MTGPLIVVRVAVAMLSSVGCGRVGFDHAPDAPETPDAPIAPDLPVLSGGNLVGYWKLDEPSGATTFADISMYANAGSCDATCPRSVAGVHGAAADFRGNGDGIRIGRPAVVSTLTEITVAAWVKLRSYAQMSFVVSADRDCGGCGLQSGFSLRASYYGDEARFHTWNTSDTEFFAAGDLVPLDRWTFLVGTYAHPSIRLFADGVLVDERQRANALGSPPTYALFIGAMAAIPSQGLDGAVDEVMIFDRALNASEVLSLHQAFAP
jgi:hypothetical protein